MEASDNLKTRGRSRITSRMHAITLQISAIKVQWMLAGGIHFYSFGSGYGNVGHNGIL